MTGPTIYLTPQILDGILGLEKNFSGSSSCISFHAGGVAPRNASSRFPEQVFSKSPALPGPHLEGNTMKRSYLQFPPDLFGVDFVHEPGFTCILHVITDRIMRFIPDLRFPTFNVIYRHTVGEAVPRIGKEGPLWFYQEWTPKSYVVSILNNWRCFQEEHDTDEAIETAIKELKYMRLIIIQPDEEDLPKIKINFDEIRKYYEPKYLPPFLKIGGE